MKTNRLTELAMLTALALIIFIVELQIPAPFPIPGVKLGLANIITVYAIYHYRTKEVLGIVLVRILLGSLFSGNMMALLYSMAGGLLCLLGMVLLKSILSPKYIWICSVLGAVLHNVGQIGIACLIAGWGMLWHCCWQEFSLQAVPKQKAHRRSGQGQAARLCRPPHNRKVPLFPSRSLPRRSRLLRWRFPMCSSWQNRLPVSSTPLK